MKDYTGVYELSNEGTISECLGINDNRAEELSKHIFEAVQNSDRITQTMEALWNKAQHPNEFAWMMFMYGSKTGVNRALGDLPEFLKSLK